MPPSRPIEIGILHSLTGTLAIGEVAVKDATLLAIEEINAAGGVLGRPLKPIVRDGSSDLQTFAREVKHLLIDEQVAVVFGCWTSSSRKAVLPLFERYNGLLFYPASYEGLEQSPNIVYTGAVPNQQILPALEYLLGCGKRRIFLLGSDYILSRTANRIIKARLGGHEAEWVGEEYLPFGSTDTSTVIAHIQATQPDAIFNTLAGDSNIAFFQDLRRAHLTSDRLQVMSTSISEVEIRAIGAEAVAGHLVAWHYFQTLDTLENQRFVAAYQARYGIDRVTGDPVEAAYTGVYLWKAAVETAGSIDSVAVREALRNLEFAAPGGTVRVDRRTQHLWKTARVGRVRSDGSIEEIWSSEEPIAPDPFLKTRPWAAGLSPKGFIGSIRITLIGLFLSLAGVGLVTIGVGWRMSNHLERHIKTLVRAVPQSALDKGKLTKEQAKQALRAADRAQSLLVAALLLSLVMMPIALLVVLRITRALTQVRQAAQLLASGDFSARSSIVSGDEIGVLSATLNTLAQQVNSLLKSLEVRSQQLELRSRELEIAKEAAEAANEAKNLFLGNMSHELRTPLNAIINYSALLQEDALDLGLEAQEGDSDDPADTFVADLQTINRAGKHLLALIEDVLDISKIEAGTMELRWERFPVAALIDDVVATMQPTISQHHNTLTVRCDPAVGSLYADPVKVQQILFNLLGNAAKFTESGSIALTVRRTRHDEDKDRSEWVVFSIADTGIGIDPKHQSDLFEAFTQGDNSTTRGYGGMGLGLAICKNFCQMMGGYITVESELGRGSTFTVFLPDQTPMDVGNG
ncbi:MAG: HAMP domain-containing protein [Cyanobacteria bacterium J055]|nr:MAG: HAMP domain-containing protein [Cyanobacteria bacterium J055]